MVNSAVPYLTRILIDFARGRNIFTSRPSMILFFLKNFTEKLLFAHLEVNFLRNICAIESKNM